MRAIASTAGPGAVVGEFTFQTFNQFPGNQALDRLQAYAKIFNPNGQIIMVSPEEFTVYAETVTGQRGALLSDIKSTVH